MRNILSPFSFFLPSHKEYERHPVRCPITSAAAFLLSIYPSSVHSFIHSLPFSPLYHSFITKDTSILLSCPFFNPPFRQKLPSHSFLTVTHSMCLPPYPIYSAQCPCQFVPCVSSITLLFSSIHPSSQAVFPVDDHPPSFASFDLSFSLGRKPARKLLYSGSVWTLD